MGKKRGFVVGINDPKDDEDLRGCVNDAIRIKDLLIRYYGFAPDDVKLAVDSNGSSCTLPLNEFLIKKKNKKITDEYICKNLSKMIKNSREGDTIFFYFAGHGGISKKPSKYNNDSGFEEFMYCHENTSIDDSALRHLVQTVPEGCSFIFVADCCRSGGLLEGSNEIIGHSKQGFKVSGKRFKPWKKSCELGSPTTNRPKGIFISSCQFDQTSNERFYADRSEIGAYFTRALMSVIEETNGNISYVELVRHIQSKLNRERYIQTAGLYCDENQKDLMFLGGRN